MAARRKELLFQGHIIASYKKCGGYAKKWSSSWTVGVQDLVCNLPGLGTHLVEVKHRPTWSFGKNYKNPLEAKQLDEAKKALEGGGISFIMVVIGNQKAIGTHLCLFRDPLAATITPTPGDAVPYINGKKYDVKKLVMEGFKQ